MLTTNEEPGELINSEVAPIPLQINWDGPGGFDGREIASDSAWMLEGVKGMEIVTVEENVLTLSEVSLWVLSQCKQIVISLVCHLRGWKSRLLNSSLLWNEKFR